MGARVVAVGGAGQMGRHAVELVVASSLVDDVVVADNDLERAREIAALYGSKATAAHVDVRDSESLVELFAGADLVVNTTGPFVEFGPAVLRAAIDSGVDYCDICDDYGPTRVIFDEMAGPAREAGIRALVGIGASPGVSNVLARHAYDSLDEVEELHTAWGVDDRGFYARQPGGRPSAALVHLLIEAAGTIPVWKGDVTGGEWVEIPAYRDPVDVRFPPAEEVYGCYPIGHPEPITLPRFLPGIRSSVDYGTVLPPRLNELVRRHADRIASGEVGGVEAAEDFIADVESAPGEWLDGAGSGPGGISAIAVGKKEGKRVRLTVAPAGWPRGRMGPSTGYPLGIAALMILEGAVSEPGVLAPEQALDPEEFMRRYSEHWDVRFVDGYFAEYLEEI